MVIIDINYYTLPLSPHLLNMYIKVNYLQVSQSVPYKPVQVEQVKWHFLQTLLASPTYPDGHFSLHVWSLPSMTR